MSTDYEIEKILFIGKIDDDFKILSSILTENEYQITGLSSKDYTFESIKTDLPDLILLDVENSELDRYNTCYELKSDPLSCNIPVLFINPLHEEECKIKGFKAGGEDYLIKPFLSHEILARVSTHLSMRYLRQMQNNSANEKNVKFQIDNEHLQFAVSSAKIATWDWNVKTNKIILTNHSEKIAGIEKKLSEIDYETYIKGVHPDDVEDLKIRVSSAFEKNLEKYESEYRIINTDGEIRWLSAPGRIFYDSNNDPVRIAGIMIDITEQKFAEDKLVKSEKRFKALFDQSARCCMLLKPTPSGIPIIAEANIAACKTHGYSRDEFIGRPVADIDDEEGKAKCLERTKHILAGNPLRIENVHEKKDGSTIPMEIHADLIKFDNGENFILTTEYDITNRNQADKILRESEAKYKALFERDSDAIFIYDPETTSILDANNATCKIYGYTKDELIGMSCYNLSADVEKSAAAIKTVQANEEVNIPVQDHKKKDGTIFPVEINGYSLTIAGKKVMFAVSKDITSRQLSEDSLKKSREELIKSEITLKAVLENAPDSVILLDLDCNIKYINRALHTKIEELINTSIYDGLSGKNLEIQKKAIEKVLKTNNKNRYEIEFQTSDNQNFTYESHIGPLTAEGKISGFVLISRDITKNKKASIEKQQLEDQLRQAHKMEEIGTLAGGIAHDFNNLLTIILGFAEIAKEDARPFSNLSQSISKILKAANRAKDLVQQILRFSRQSTIEKIPVKPEEITREALKMLRSSFPSTIEIHDNISENCGIIVADPTQLHQIIINICTNAFHSMEENGGILKVGIQVSDQIPLILHEKNDQKERNFIDISISDTGQGMSSQIMEKIFVPFFTTKDKGKGTGIGLSIAFGIVQEYGGTITVDSELQKGSTFHIFLPISEHTSIQNIKKEAIISKGKGRILFVDDEELLAEMSKVMLESLGYNVTVRLKSMDALEIFKKNPYKFDLVITDQTMPVLTGIELSKKMMKIQPDIPIILCTGYSSIVNEESAIAQGIKEFVPKPFTKNTIAMVINKVLNS